MTFNAFLPESSNCRASLELIEKSKYRPKLWLHLWLRWCLQCWRSRFDPWIGKIPWRRVWLPTPVFSPREFHGQRSLEGYTQWDRKESDTTEWVTHTQAQLSRTRRWGDRGDACCGVGGGPTGLFLSPFLLTIPCPLTKGNAGAWVTLRKQSFVLHRSQFPYL